jgi:hypothetical protein
MSFAALHLTLPNQGLHLSQDTLAVYRDVLVNQVMEAEHVGLRLEKIASYLHNLNRVPLQGEVRQELTENLIQYYLIYMQQGLAMSDRGLSATLLAECNRELSYATKLLLRDCTPRSKEEWARFLYWAISALAIHLNDFSSQYRSQPGALWGEMHRLYQFASQRRLTDFQALTPDRGDIETRYKHALLLSASQTEHLSHTERMILDAYLGHWAFRARLSHQERRDFNTRYFYIDTESNRGIQTARQIQGAGNDDSILVLNPLPVIEQARQHMKQQRQGMSPDKLGLQFSIDSIDLFMTLKKAISAWKQAGSRRFERDPLEQKSRAAIGLHSVHQYLRVNGDRDEQLASVTALNSSKQGACIRLDEEAVELNVGDVIMHRDQTGDEGRLGIIRWIHRDGRGRMCGLEYIAGNLQPVAVRFRDRLSEALLISTQGNDSLITHKGYCTSNSSIRLKNFGHGLSLEARAQSLLQRGETTDQIRLKRSAV